MPPKPFKPPRPSPTHASSSSKPRGRPKSTTSNGASATAKRQSTSAIDKPSKHRKTNPKGKDREADAARAGGVGGPRVSNASTVLDISSGSEEEEEEDEDGEGAIEGDVDVENALHSEGGEGEDDDPFSSQALPAARRRKASVPRQAGPASDGENEIEGGGGGGGGSKDGRETSIPLDLVNVLMHGFFQRENTRLSRDANMAVGRYIEIFVREGLTRAAWAKRNGWEDGGVDVGANWEGPAGGDGAYLEVEDLERLAPQLLLDF